VCPAKSPFLDGLEEVHVEASEAIDAGELRIGGLGREAIIADEAAHDGAVLLLDVGTVVFLVGAAPGEGDVHPLAVVVEDAVDELRAVVAIEAEGHRQPLLDVMDGAAHAALAFAPDGIELDPAGADVDRAEGVQGEPLGARPAVGDEIDLEEAEPGIIPVGEGAEGDLVLEPGAVAATQSHSGWREGGSGPGEDVDLAVERQASRERCGPGVRLGLAGNSGPTDSASGSRRPGSVRPVGVPPPGQAASRVKRRHRRLSIAGTPRIMRCRRSTAIRRSVRVTTFGLSIPSRFAMWVSA
jgi:hypothetical protein